MGYFFKRLEKYTEVRQTAAMADIIGKIMVEVISILGIVTKEVREGRMSTCFGTDICSKLMFLAAEKYLKKLVGRKDIEDALERLNEFTQEEARMAAAEVLVITRGIDDKVNDMDDKVEGVDSKVQGVDRKVQRVDEKVRGVDDKVQGVDDKVNTIGHKLDTVKGAVIQGESCLCQSTCHRIRPKPLIRLGAEVTKVTRLAIQEVAHQIQNLNRS